MDSHLWHRQVNDGKRAPSPQAWTAHRLDSAPSHEREQYASAVRRFLRSHPLHSAKHRHLATQLDRALAEVEDEPPGARTIISVSAPFAVGKSTLIKQWGADLYRDWVPDSTSDVLPEWSDGAGTRFDLVPIVYVTLMARSKAKDVHGAILTFLGYPSRGTTSEITLRTTTALRNHRVRLLIVDDAHMLHTKSVTGRETLDALKQINTELGELGGTLVLVGANLTNGPALRDPQIRGRLFEHHLSAYDVATVGDAGRWQEMLASAETTMRPYLPDQDSLPAELAGPIFKRTQGFIGDVSTLLAGATYNALTAGRTRLEREDLAHVQLSSRAHDGETALTTTRSSPGAPAQSARRQVS
ncbi:TniB family NTP-binding protein [Janibacter sp. DB-40]|uniref:TniB family NTP-binding protein n=1 Tax=Janibacter sp. DB-40 TaxID=3028808 RepID=UPI0024059F14|nr:TniB family NTP-binding protein [Janibacter sp. DB-40]